MCYFIFEDYNQYTVNQTVPVQHQSARVSDVSSNSKQYHQKPKKVTVNDADKYNLNRDVTVQDYEIYDNQVRFNRFFINTTIPLDHDRVCVIPLYFMIPGSLKQKQIPAH